MGLAAQYQLVSQTDPALVLGDQTKLTADQASDAADIAAFVAALGTGALFVSANGVPGNYDLVVPDGAGSYKVSGTFPLAT